MVDQAVEVVTGRAAVHEGFVAVTDLAWLAGAGIPGVTFGPASAGNAHGDDEHIAVADLTEGILALALVVCGWCGVEEA